MAGSVFGFDAAGPMDGFGAVKPTTEDPKARFDRLAGQYQVPANLLIALTEAGGDVSKADAIAADIGARVKSGKTLDMAVSELAGSPEKSAALMSRAYDIADMLYPRQVEAEKPVEPSMPRDLAAGAGGAVVSGAGLGVDYVGSAMGRAMGVPDENTTLGEYIGSKLKGAGQKISSYVSPETQRLRDATLPKGDVTDPSTWQAPEDVNLRGVMQAMAEGLGSMAPVVVTALATRGSSLAAGGVGGAMAGGDGRDTAAQIIDQKWQERGDDGKSSLERESDVYRALISEGKTPNQAYTEVRNRAMNAAGDYQAVVGGVGGAVTGGIVSKGLPAALAGKSAIANAGRGVAVSAVEEGVQEAGETAAARTGVNQASNLGLNVTEGTVEAAAAGALAGGPVGGLAGMSGAQGEPQPAPGLEPDPLQITDQSKRLALPAPGSKTLALPAPPKPPGTGFVMVDGEAQASPADGSGGGDVAASGGEVNMPASPGAAIDPMPKPTGILSQAAAVAPDLRPIPEAPAPESLFPDQKPGNALRLQTPDGSIIDATYLREGPNGVTLRVGGETFDVSPQEFDQAVNGARAADLAAKEAKSSKGATKAAQPAPAPIAETKPASPVAAPEPQASGPLAQQAVAAVRQPKAASPKMPDMTPEKAMEMIKTIEETAKRGGWTKRLIAKKEELSRIAAPAMQKPGGADDKGNSGAAPLPMDGLKNGGKPSPAIGDDNAGASIKGKKNNPKGTAGGTGDPQERPTGPGLRSNMDDADQASVPVDKLNNTPEYQRPTPMVADPTKRIQPDLLGGETTTEADMAAKERKKREWGQLLGVAENRSGNWDGEIEGRVVTVRGNRLRIRLGKAASDADYTLDTEGMDRSAIAGWVRNTLAFAERQNPLPKPVSDQGAVEKTADEVKPAAKSAKIEPKAQHRANMDALDKAQAAESRASDDLLAVDAKDKDALRAAATKLNASREEAKLASKKVDDYLSSLSASERKAATYIAGDRTLVDGIKVTPTAAEVKAAAAEAEATSTDADPKIPSGYTLGSVIKMDAARASRVSGDPDAAGGDWGKGDFHAVISRDRPYSIVGAYGKTRAGAIQNALKRVQSKAPLVGKIEMDPPISADETFAMGQKAFKDGYRRDLPDSIAFMSKPGVREAWYRGWDKANLEAPMPEQAEPKVNAAPAKPAGIKGLSDAENAKMAELQARFKAKMNSQINTGLDPEMVSIAVQIGALYVKSGVRRFRSLVESMMNDMGLTLEQAQPYARNAYNQIRGDMELDGEDVSDMDSDSEVISEVRKMRAANAKAPKAPELSPDAQNSANIGASNEEGATDDTGIAIHQGSSSELEGPSSKPISDVSAGEPAGTRGAEGEQGRSGPSGEADGQGDATARSGGDGSAGDGEPAAKRVAKAKRAKKSAVNPDEGGLFTADAPKVLAAKVNVPAVNFTITDDVRLGKGGMAEKFSDNLAAIRTLKQIQRENRRASPSEQAVLARYVGWGGMKNAFRVAGSKGADGIAKGWEKRAAELEDLLEPAEYAAARNSTKAAHYTSQSVVKAIWDGARKLGFRGGAVLEPSVGTGNFLGLMPHDLRQASHVTAVEYDALTAGIAKLLYPASNVLHSGFEKLPIPKGSQSLAIGNPPFGKDQLYFRHTPEINRKTIHNQFFLASMDSLAPGGILAMVVSHYLMDSLDNANRLAMAERAALVHAIRLPSNAFEENANTEVVTDILFFRKHDATDAIPAINAAMYHGREAAEVRSLMGKKEATREQIDRAIVLMSQNSRWVDAEKINDPAGSGETINVNSYFLRNKGRMIGRLDASGTMNGRAGLNVTMDDPKAFAEQLNAAIEAMPQVQPVDGIVERTKAGYAAMSESLTLAARNAEPGEVRVDENGMLKMVIDAETLGDSKSMLLELDLTEETPWHSDYSYRADRKWQITEDVKDEAGKPVKQKKADGTTSTRNQKRITVLENTADIPTKRKWGAKRIEVLRALIPVKQLMKRQFMLESQDGTDQQIEGNRAKLNAAYDDFVKKHGKLNGKATAEIAFQMPDGALALGAEVVGKDGSISKSAIMSERITRPFVMADKADTPADALAISLSERGTVDIERVAGLLGVDVEKASDMLSSSEKPLAFLDPETNGWETADAYLSGPVKRKLYAARQAGLEKNVTALMAVQPEQWDSTQISPNIGSTWIPPSIYRDFLKHLGYSNASMAFMSVTNTFSGDVDGNPKPVWQTTGRAFSPSEIVFRLLNSLPMKVTYTDSEKRTHVDEQASVESQQKATEISSEFLDWVYQDTKRREVLVETFNERYNTRVIRQRDGSHLKMPTKGPKITLRRHQINAIWRGITDKAVLYDHAVGAGKTFTAIARIMERRRMGLSRKPMVVVPNHLIEQWAADFKVLYPGANVLAAGKADFETNNRRRLFAKIASGDYDAVIIGHSSFNFIDIDPSTEMRFLEEELRAANEAIKEAEEAAAEEGLDTGWRKPMGVAEAERLVTKIQTRLDRLREGKRDRLLTFEEMGIDDLTVDESHEFKNLAYSSRLQNVSGMGNKNGSAKATNLHLKARSLHEREGTSMAFLSGTPISNSVSEMYLILRNLVPNELREMGLENFDAWRSAFVSVATQWEPTESGGLKEVSRLGREWTNMRALMDLYYSVADAVPIEDVIKNYPLDNDGKRFPIPPVRSKEEGKGDREMVAVKPDEAQRIELRNIVSGFESLPGMEVKERNAERLRLMDRARKVSLDARAANPSAKVADGTGKIGATVANVVRLYEKWNEDKGTQVIFLDRSVPKAQGAEKFVAEYDDLVEKLRIAEIDEKEKEIERLVEKLDKYDANEVQAQRIAIAGGWNAYSEIRRQLIAKGIPAEEIAFVQDANTDAEKKELFERVNSGEVRVILGSTPRMGAGTNIQKRLVGLHHVDVTWKPSDIEQREGRIVRFGNDLLDKYGFDLFNVDVIAYATEMTVDAKMWALNATKLKAINGIRKYDGSFNMEFEDEESANMAEMAALATGNPLMVERVMLDGELKKMDMSRRTFNNRMNGMRAELDQANKTIATADDRVAQAKGFAGVLRDARGAAMERSANRKIDIDGKTLKSATSALAAIQKAIDEQRAGDENARWSIQINGNKVTTSDTANSEIQRVFGTDGFEASVNGKTEVAFSRASSAIADHINRTVAAADGSESVAIDGITILGMPVEVDSYIDQYSKEGSKNRIVSFTFLHNKKEAWSTEQRASDGTISQQAVRAALDKIFEWMTPEQQEENASYYAAEKVRAIAKKPDLEVELAKAWPLAQDYETKKARQAEVIASLEKASVNDQLDSDELEGKESRIAPDGAEKASIRLRDLNVAVREELDRVGLTGRVAVRVASTMGKAGVFGRYRAGEITISDGPGALAVLDHEIIHAMRDMGDGGLFTKDEWQGLVRAARADKELMARVESAYADLSTIGQMEEAVAELYRGWASGDRQLGAGAKAFAKVKAFFEALGNVLIGRGFQSAGKTMQDIASGKIGARDGGFTESAKVSEYRNTSSPGFAKWFGDSKVVDADGKPLVVYHGTGADFETFDNSKTGSNDRGLWGRGHYLTSSSETANSYALREGEGARVIPAYVSIKNPLVLNTGKDLITRLPDGTNTKDLVGPNLDGAKIKEIAISGGHDGVIQIKPDGSIGDIVAFSPSQIKSVFNRGKWDGANPNILDFRADLLTDKFKGMLGNKHWRKPDAAFFSSLLTDAMAGKNGYDLLSMVPGRALFTELGKNLLSARAYQRGKEKMDTLRQDWHARADVAAQEWRKLRNKHPRDNDAFMDLMHRTTLAGIDPSKDDTWRHAMHEPALREVSKNGDKAADWAKDVVKQIEAHKRAYRTLREKFAALPPAFQAMYSKLRAEYDKLGDDFEAAVIENIENATRIGLKRAEKAYRVEMQRIKDEGLKGAERDDAIAMAESAVQNARKRGGWGAKARIGLLRASFESNRLKGPYFPLARFGDYFVTIRDADGKVISFSRFEREADQKREVARAEQLHPGRVKFGVISKAEDGMKGQVDPTFVADIEKLLSDAGAETQVMDAVWQRWLETLPDQSIRTSKIHRKGREGWNADAFKAFGRHMFHGAHQLARLKYGLILEEHLNDAEDEARIADDPNRAMLVVNEMRRRHAFTMNPTGGAIPAALSQLAFIWYLGATPAAAIANLSQTTIVGIPVLAAKFKGAGISGSASALGKAMKDLALGKGDVSKSPNVTDDERSAIHDAYQRGTIDRTQGHDLAAVAESGLEYNAGRERIMKGISWFFHTTEKANREVTFLAAYRLAKDAGQASDVAVNTAADMTWKTHFDYQNTARPRFMQGDIGKILTTFRNFTVNMLYRLFRDTHQSLVGKSAEDRAEARTQLIGLTLSMMAHAGIKGTWGYGIIMLLAGLFFPGGGDDAEKWLQDSLLVEGDGPGIAAWNYTMGAALNGVPGQLTGVDLVNRIGMPNLWFRGSDRDLEGEDLYNAYLYEVLGPVVGGIAPGMVRGVGDVLGGDVERGVEAMVPKMLRDVMKAGRYVAEGVETRNGDTILESVNPYQALMQASGFTPAAIAERYQINSRLKNEEKRITDERTEIQRAAGDLIRAGEPISESVVEQIREFNATYPEYPITSDTIKQSVRSRIRASDRNEFGVALNPKLNDRLRGNQPPVIYQ